MKVPPCHFCLLSEQKNAYKQLCGTVTTGHLLYECGSFKVQNSLLTELRLDVVSPQPLNHIDVRREVSEGLDGITNQQDQKI